jgi:hypothetical protein
MSSHPRHDSQQRVPRSTTIAAFTGVGLVIFGVVLSLWQSRSDTFASATGPVSAGSVDGGVLASLQNLAPTFAGIIVAIVAVTFVVLFKGRRHQD